MTCLDRKPVREALGTSYLTVLEALDEGLKKRGVPERDLPQSTARLSPRHPEVLRGP